MIRLFLMLITLFAMEVPAAAGELILRPAVVRPGAPVMIRLPQTVEGSATGRLLETTFSFRRDEAGLYALAPVPLETPAGEVPVSVMVASPDGSHSRLVEGGLLVVTDAVVTDRLELPESMVTLTDPDLRRRVEEESARLQLLLEGVTEPVNWRGFALPVREEISSDFGRRRILNGKPRSPHRGTDFRTPRGTPVAASAAGSVVLADDLYYTGLTMVLDHGGGLYTLYAHLDRIDRQPRVRVRTGEQIALSGMTGRSTGPHLHWGASLLGVRINPVGVVDLAPYIERKENP